MPDKEPKRRKPGLRPKRAARAQRLALQRSTDGTSWVFVHPRCVRERADDLEEVRQIIEAGEHDIALDELRWLLEDCQEFLEAHNLLGELAVTFQNNVALARGHFGAGYQLGLQALRRAGMPTPLVNRLPANRPFFDAGRGLAISLAKLEKFDLAEEVVGTLLQLDPADPLQLRSMLDDLRTGGQPIVDLQMDFPSQND